MRLTSSRFRKKWQGNKNKVTEGFSAMRKNIQDDRVERVRGLEERILGTGREVQNGRKLTKQSKRKGWTDEIREVTQKES